MQQLLEDTYSGKKVFLTGHTGFKGSWMAFILNQLGAKVKGYALAPEMNQSLYDLIRVGSFTESIIANIIDYKKLEKEIINFQPDFVFHFAAQSLVIRSYDEPANTYETNVMGTVNVLEAMRKYEHTCQVIVITTDKVYENIEREYAYKENDKLGGFDPYSSSKAAAEIATSSYRQSFFNPSKYDLHQKSIATARSGNVIGGGDWSDNRIIPDLIRSIDRQQSLEIRNPHSIRPWQHLLDPLSGYLLLGAKMADNPVKYARAYNFGPKEDINLTVEALVKKAIAILGKGDYLISDNLVKRHEASLLHLDISKAQNELGWQPRLSANEAIQMTMEWYRDFRNDPFSITFKQVNDYFNL
jgi:CDP-glucose 4,6-dehydratase